jgi:multiple sugar transport system substrate-binding protein
MPHRLLITLAAALLGGAFLGGCSPDADDGVVTIEFWAMGREGEVVQALVPDFERAHPGIRVEVQQLPWTSAHEKLLTAFAGRSTPDLCQLGNTWVPEMVALGALEPLGPRVARSDVVEQPDYFEGVWDTNVLGGEPYGVPWYVDTRLLFYRSDLLRAAGYEAVPQTWARWLEAMRAVKANAGPDQYAVLLPLNEFEPPLILGLQAGDLLREGDRYGAFREPGFRRAFEFYINLFREGLAPPVTGAQISNVWQEFANGYFTFYITGPWNIGEFRRRLPPEMEGRWMTAPLPGPDGPGVSVAGGSSLAVFERSEHKAEAWALVEYLSRPDVQVRFHELTGNLPARESAWADPVLAGNPYAAAFREQLRRVRPTPKIPEQERIAQTIREYAEFAASGAMTVDEALSALDRDVDRLLEKRRWLLQRASTEG